MAGMVNEGQQAADPPETDETAETAEAVEQTPLASSDPLALQEQLQYFVNQITAGSPSMDTAASRKERALAQKAAAQRAVVDADAEYSLAVSNEVQAWTGLRDLADERISHLQVESE